MLKFLANRQHSPLHNHRLHQPQQFPSTQFLQLVEFIPYNVKLESFVTLSIEMDPVPPRNPNGEPSFQIAILSGCTTNGGWNRRLTNVRTFPREFQSVWTTALEKFDSEIVISSRQIERTGVLSHSMHSVILD